MPNPTHKTLLYTGSFQPQFISSLAADTDINGQGDGIYTYILNEETGELTLKNNTYAIINPSRLCLSPSQNRLYAASDTNAFLNWQPGTGGGIYAFNMLPGGTLKLLDSRSSCGVRAVDIACDTTGQYVLVANMGSIFCTTQFTKNKEGHYQPTIRHDEGCITLLRCGQTGFEAVCHRLVLPGKPCAHPSSIHLDSDNFVYLTNQSDGTVHILKLDTQNEKLLPISIVQTSGGPDGFAPHPHIPLFYTSCQATGKIHLYRFDKDRKTAQLVQSTYEEEPSNPGQLEISADGKTLYAADKKRGEIKVYGVSEEGKLLLLQRVQDKVPFHGDGTIYSLTLAPSGGWLMASNMRGNSLLAFPIAPSGTLGEPASTASPTPTGLLAHSISTFSS